MDGETYYDIEMVAFINYPSRYPYPGLANNSTWEKFFFCLASAGLMTGITMFLKLVHDSLNKVRGLERGILDSTRRRNKLNNKKT